MLAKFLASTIAKTILGWWKAMTRDKLNRDLGAFEAHQEVQSETIQELKHHGKIEREDIVVDDAIIGFRLHVKPIDDE